MKEILYRYNPWWDAEFSIPEAINRPTVINLLKKNLPSQRIVFITGLRRVGKTTSLKLFIKHLIENENINPKRILYVSLDDYLLIKKNIIEIVDEFRKIHKIKFREKVYLFFDEIGFKDNFEIQLKNLVDNQNVKIYASSSSATVIKNKKTYLTGRNIVIEVMPLDFEEFLRFRNITVSNEDSHLIEEYFEDFLKTGGMPEYVLHQDIESLKELVDDILYKDIAAVHGIRHINILKDFFVLLMERAGKQASINKLSNILSISPDTVKRYLQMFADTYLIHLVQRYGKTNEKLLSPKKIYAADLGIRVLFTGFRDKGSLFENYVYLKIKHLNPYYIYKDQTELDFFIPRPKTLIEVKYRVEMTKKQRELFEQFPAKNKILITSPKDLELLSPLL